CFSRISRRRRARADHRLGAGTGDFVRVAGGSRLARLRRPRCAAGATTMRCAWPITRTDPSEMQEPPGVSSQDAIEVARRQLQLFDERVGVLDVLRGEEIRTDHDTVRADLADQEPQRFGIVIEVVVVEAPEVFPEWTLRLQLRGSHVKEAVLDTREDERKRASAMGQHDLEPRELIECPGGDEPEPVGDAGWADQARAVEVRFAIERMEQQRIPQFLASREDRLEGRLEQVIALLD